MQDYEGTEGTDGMDGLDDEDEDMSEYRDPVVPETLYYRTLRLYDIRDNDHDRMVPTKPWFIKVGGIKNNVSEDLDPGLDIEPIDSNSIMGKLIDKPGVHKIKMNTVITLYSEEFFLLENSMRGVCQSMVDMYEEKRNCREKNWDEWEDFKDDFLVTIIQDGFKNMHKDFWPELQKLGFFDMNKMTPFRSEAGIRLQTLELKPVSKLCEERIEVDGQKLLKFGIKTRKEKELEKRLRSGRPSLEDIEMSKYSLPMNLLHTFQAEVEIGKFLDLKDENLKNFYTNKKINIIYVTKHFNNQKIDSHLVFYEGFCRPLNPKYVQLLDCGTEALPNSINRIVRLLDTDPKLSNGKYGIGGVSGEIMVDFGEKGCPCDFWKWLQYIEYKLSHFIDKSFEAFLGYQSVLPGAFSTFRWDAIKNKPLEKFYAGLNKEIYGILRQNMFLAEDRIMCYEIVHQMGESYSLLYLPGAVAITDPPDHFVALIQQRRRWVNGSMATTLHLCSKTCKGQMCKSGQP